MFPPFCVSQKIAEHKDQKIFRYLKSIADPTTSFSELNKATDEIAQRLGSKSQTGTFARSLARRCGLFFCNKEMILELVAIASEELEVMSTPQTPLYLLPCLIVQTWLWIDSC